MLLRQAQAGEYANFIVRSRMMENSSPFTGDPAPTVDRHTTSAFAGRPVLRVVTLSLRSVN